jgi:hypothetical protein
MFWFQMPKLECEGEAAYLCLLLRCIEDQLLSIDHDYIVGSIRVIVVFESPRAMFRINEVHLPVLFSNNLHIFPLQKFII